MDILYESPWTLVVSKPAGLLVEHSPHGYPSVEDWANDFVARQPGKNFIGIVHRLDRLVSGALLLAKRKQALKELNEQFREHKVKKIYWGIVEKAPPARQGRLVHWLVKDQLHKKAVVSSRKVKNSMEVSLSYQVLAQSERGVLLEIDLHTGKFHQIRAQLAAVGCPILGDDKYGATLPYRPGAIALHARQLVFTDPGNGELQTVKAPMPEDEWWIGFSR